jgi:hypothetical protein
VGTEAYVAITAKDVENSTPMPRHGPGRSLRGQGEGDRSGPAGRHHLARRARLDPDSTLRRLSREHAVGEDRRQHLCLRLQPPDRAYNHQTEKSKCGIAPKPEQSCTVLMTERLSPISKRRSGRFDDAGRARSSTSSGNSWRNSSGGTALCVLSPTTSPNTSRSSPS